MKEPYSGKCIIQLESGLYVCGPNKDTEDVNLARVFRNPSAADHILTAGGGNRSKWHYSGRFKYATILPVRLVQIGKPLVEEKGKWFKG